MSFASSYRFHGCRLPLGTPACSDTPAYHFHGSLSTASRPQQRHPLLLQPAASTFWSLSLSSPPPSSAVRDHGAALGHPNVVNLKLVYEDAEYVHLVMELCAGGELFHRLEKHGHFSEREAVVLFRHLMEVVLHYHKIGIVHRDLKPKNILLANKSSSTSVWPLISRQRLYETVGSPFYIAPEVSAGGYNQAADIWSVGVILYVLLSGMPPFWGKTRSRIFNTVRTIELKFPFDPWCQVSDSAKELVAGMLCRDSLQRLTAKQVLGRLTT